MIPERHNPDVLSCLANLSNDEVFTPPEVANRMLDLLPAELWSNPDAKFLDPFTKTGVFLREIARRLIIGLEPVIPDLHERVEHIMLHQLYGIAITELTGCLARRSVYCSKHANGKYSVAKFADEEGNIRFRRTEHSWQGGKCRYCGASRDVYDRGEELETYAYEFIHTNNPQEIFNNMRFDVIIGNPPYQLCDGGNAASAVPIYHKFVLQAIKFNPKYLTMIIPARWFAGGRGLDSFRNEMLNDRRIKVLVDYFDSNECFPGIDLSGGVCYFLWDKEYNGKCEVISTYNGLCNTMQRHLMDNQSNTFIRFNESVPIICKIKSHSEESFDNLVSAQQPFGLRTYFKGEENTTAMKNAVNIHTSEGVKYIERENVILNTDWIDRYKVYISAAYGERGDFPYLVIGKPFIGRPNTCCTETYLCVGPIDSQDLCLNVITYMRTKFFRFLVLMIKNSQHAAKSVYKLVPIQDFSEPWTDEKLYQKYGLTPDEIAFIESMIRPME